MSGVVGSKLRQYVHGILMVLLASFILVAISSLVETVPESKLDFTTTTVTVTRGNYTLELIGSYSYTATLQTSSGYCTAYGVNLDSPSAGYKYMVVFTKPSTPLTALYYYDRGGNRITITPYTNDTHVVGFITTSISTIYVCVQSTPYYTGRISMYRVPLSLTYEDLNPVTVTTTITVAEISNKTILAFIMWASSIALIITALRQFDISI